MADQNWESATQNQGQNWESVNQNLNGARDTAQTETWESNQDDNWESAHQHQNDGWQSAQAEQTQTKTGHCGSALPEQNLAWLVSSGQSDARTSSEETTNWESVQTNNEQVSWIK